MLAVFRSYALVEIGVRTLGAIWTQREVAGVQKSQQKSGIG
jgi:hypothetical protein